MKLAELMWPEKLPRDVDYLRRIHQLDNEDDFRVFQVPSQTGRATYKVWLGGDVGACSCAGWGTRLRKANEGGTERVAPCKHIAAARAFQLWQEQPREDLKEDATPKGGKNPLKVWPSAIPLIQQCQAVLEEGEIQIDVSGDPAKLGSAAHEVAKHTVLDQELEAAEAYLARHGLGAEHAEDLRYLGRAAYFAWGQLKRYFRNPVVEQPLEYTVKDKRGHEVTFRGKADLHETFEEEDGKRATVLDWKGGRSEGDYLGQLQGYAVLVAAQDKAIQSVTTIVCWLRSQAVVTKTFTRQELNDWLKTFMKRYSWWDGKTYGPGEHCRYCKRRLDCPGRLESLRSGVAALTSDQAPQLFTDKEGNLLPVEKILSAYRQAKMLKAMIREFEDQLRQELAQRGSIPIPDKPGYVLGCQERQGHEEVDPSQAWDVLTSELGEDKLKELVQLPSKAVKDALAAQAERGKKKARIEEVWHQLGSAVSRKPSYPVLTEYQEEKGGNDG